MKQLACILIALAIGAVYGDEPDKLVGGEGTDIKAYPHCVSLRMNNNHMCGGSLISNQHVLTAAHCLVMFKQNPAMIQRLTIVTGTTHLNYGGQYHKVAQLWYHENYNPNHPAGRGPYDIGLIKLAAPVQLSPTQQPINLPTSDIKKGESVTIAAWGSTGRGGPIHTNLQKLHAKAMLSNVCQQYHQNVMPVHPTNEFCTLIEYGIGLCNGDSGSGLIRDSDKTIAGLVSGGRPCAMGYPDVYTKVFSYVSWIRYKMSL